MKKAHVVVGANFGDEGKGLVTDFLASQLGSEALIVRFNGGAQAGHTVVTPQGQRHVFGHFGSGSFVGCPTFLSRFFVCNPLTFLKELAQLATLGVQPVVFVDPQSPITTPYDMILNQAAEDTRAEGRHGSCGLGFGETLERSLHTRYRLVYQDLFYPDRLRSLLRALRKEWVPQRARDLGLVFDGSPWMQIVNSDAMLENFLSDVTLFLSLTHCAAPDLLLKKEHLLFEGAQGLLLDQDYGCFPHVTRSNTGLKNVVALAQEAEITDLNVTYLTRSYLTRHGAGPMPFECPQKIYAKIFDPTNIPNLYQGSLRFGLLDLDLLTQSIIYDQRYLPAHLRSSIGVSVSCMDQIEGPALYRANGRELHSTPEAFLYNVKMKTGASTLFASYGPTRDDVRLFAAASRLNNRGFEKAVLTHELSGAIEGSLCANLCVSL